MLQEWSCAWCSHARMRALVSIDLHMCMRLTHACARAHPARHPHARSGTRHWPREHAAQACTQVCFFPTILKSINNNDWSYMLAQRAKGRPIWQWFQQVRVACSERVGRGERGSWEGGGDLRVQKTEMERGGGAQERKRESEANEEKRSYTLIYRVFALPLFKLRGSRQLRRIHLEEDPRAFCSSLCWFFWWRCLTRPTPIASSSVRFPVCEQATLRRRIRLTAKFGTYLTRRLSLIDRMYHGDPQHCPLSVVGVEVTINWRFSN
eukprot:6186697-Pleurochrysis_carterae.AAC.1